MAQPGRSLGGLTTDAPFQALADFGLPNPFLYHFWEDDFDDFKTATGAPTYIVTASGNGTVVTVAGDGGQIIYTTNSSTPASTDLCSIELPKATYMMMPNKKAFFMTRVALTDATNPALIAGLINTDTTPFTSITDGIWFSKASGATALNLNMVTNSGTTVVTSIPTNADLFTSSTCSMTSALSTAALGNGYTLTVTAISAGKPAIGMLVTGASVTTGMQIIGYGTATATSPLGTYIVNIPQTLSSQAMIGAGFVDLAWEFNPRSTAAAPYGRLQAYVGSPNGYINSDYNNVYPNGFVTSYPLAATTTLTTNILNPTIALQSGTATSKVMYCDLLFAARER